MIDPMNLEPTEWVQLCTLCGIHEDDWGDAWLHLRDHSDGKLITKVDAIATMGQWDANRKSSQSSEWIVDQLNGTR